MSVAETNTDDTDRSIRPRLQVPDRPLPPNPSLLALFLVTRSGSGPRIVAHYPPSPSLQCPNGDVTVPDGHISEDDQDAGSQAGDDNDQARSDDDADAGQSVSGRGPASMGSLPSKGYCEGGYSFYDTIDELAEPSVVKQPTTEEKQSGWDKLFGYSTDSLARIMAPNAHSWHMSRLEVCMGGRTFVGCPAYRFDTGKWRRPRLPKTGIERQETDSTLALAGQSSQASSPTRTMMTMTMMTTDSQRSLDKLGADIDDDEPEVPETPDVAAASKPAFLTAHQDQASSLPDALGLSTSTPSNYSAASSTSSSSLTMFTIVAVVSPPSLEHQLRVEEHFQFVLKPLCATLKRLQRKDGYLETQARMFDKVMGEARERGASPPTCYIAMNAVPKTLLSIGLSYDEAWQRVASMCTLAKTLRTAFDAISTSQVANLSFKSSSAIDVSIQIPLPTSTPFAPTPMTTQIPGLALSSAIYTASGPGTLSTPLTTVDSISPHAALLLLHDNQDVLAQQLAASPLTSTHGMAGPMSYFIRNLTPRKTLLQLSRLHLVPLSHLQLLAGLLIRWRHARPIAPLHGSNAYIVSANAKWNELQVAREAYARRYPTLPEMVLMLSKLSGTGRTASLVPWASLIPSSDHKDVYMDVLAWLMRGGWVTQLRTFAWIRVSPAVKRAVAEQRRRDVEDLARADHLENAVDDSHTDLDELSGFGTPQRRPSSGDYGAAVAAGHTHGLLPHHFKPHLLPPARPVSEAGSTGSKGSKGSNRTTFHVPPATPLSPPKQSSQGRRKRSSESNEAASELVSHVTRAITTGSGSTAQRLAKRTSLEMLEADVDEPTIILDPARLNHVQARWVEHIRRSFGDERLRAAWPRLVKYFDGRHALQEIAVMEGWKRKATTQLLAAVIREGDCLQIVRHW